MPNPYLAGTQNSQTTPFPSLFPGTLIGSINGGALAAAQGLSPSAVPVSGSFGFGWRRWEIEVVGDGVTWSVNGLPIARSVDGVNGNVPLTGSISLGYMDIFNSPTGLPDLHFAIIDNLTVTALPEPAACGPAVATLAAIFHRRRRGPAGGARIFQFY